MIELRPFAAAALTATLLGTLAPLAAEAAPGHAGHAGRPITVYLTRHAEKQTTTTSLGGTPRTYELAYQGDEAFVTLEAEGADSKGDVRDDVCGTSKCAEELNPLGLARAELLADWFGRHGVTQRLDKVVSSHKRRTFQTVDPTAVEAGLTVVQVPAGGTELEPESTTPSECPTIAEILASAPGDTVLVAGHSGTLYDIMGAGNDDCAGLGLDVSDAERFPRDAKGKVRDFGDVWKVLVYVDAEGGLVGSRFGYRVNLQPKGLFVADFAR